MIYNRPGGTEITGDNSEIYNLEDKGLLEDFPKVLSLSELFKDNNKTTSFNHYQILIYANCSKFISVQGGNSVLSSYFGGDNIILAKRGLEIEMEEYSTIYPKLSDARIHHVENENRLLNKVHELFIDK